MRKSHWIVFGSVVCVSAGTAVLWGAGEGDPPHLTQIEEVIMYGIDAGTHELLRYEFSTDAYMPIGVVKDQNDNVVTDIEGLALIPHGPHKGLYGTANYYEQWPSKLVKISGLDAKGQVYPANIGFEKVEGLVAVQNPDTLQWSLLGVAKNPNPSLIRIDPATGTGSLIMETDNRYLGLAIGVGRHDLRCDQGPQPAPDDRSRVRTRRAPSASSMATRRSKRSSTPSATAIRVSRSRWSVTTWFPTAGRCPVSSSASPTTRTRC